MSIEVKISKKKIPYKKAIFTLEKRVEDVKKGKIDFKVDKTGIVHAAVGKTSFDAQKLAENSEELIQTIVKLKPSAAKGTYIKSISISSTMGIGIAVSTNAY